MPHSRPMASIGRGCHELRVLDRNEAWRVIFRIDTDAADPLSDPMKFGIFGMNLHPARRPRRSPGSRAPPRRPASIACGAESISCWPIRRRRPRRCRRPRHWSICARRWRSSRRIPSACASRPASSSCRCATRSCWPSNSRQSTCSRTAAHLRRRNRQPGRRVRGGRDAIRPQGVARRGSARRDESVVDDGTAAFFRPLLSDRRRARRAASRAAAASADRVRRQDAACVQPHGATGRRMVRLWAQPGGRRAMYRRHPARVRRARPPLRGDRDKRHAQGASPAAIWYGAMRSLASIG